MKNRSVIAGVVLLVVLFITGLGMAGLAIAGQTAEGPDQPVAFPHARHTGGLGMDCTYCHRGANEEAWALIPALETCIGCHSVVAPNSLEIQKLKDAVTNNRPIDWVRVHRQPDHVHFVHASHIQAGFQCENCHGNMQAPDPEENPLIRAFQTFSYSPYMGAGFDAVKNAYGLGYSGKVKQVRPLGMGDCVNCHRGQNELNKVGPLDCSICHY